MNHITFHITTSRDGKAYFTIRASNGEKLATSETYNDIRDCRHAVGLIQALAEHASIVEED